MIHNHEWKEFAESKNWYQKRDLIGVSQVAGQQKQLPPDNFDFCVFLFSISHLSARNSSMLTSFVILVEEERLLLHLIQQLNLFVR